MLATVMFTDIVGSTEPASRLGDGRWRELLAEHNALVRTRARPLARDRGQDDRRRLPGDVRRARARRAMRGGDRRRRGRFGLRIRAGLHTGECELVGQDVAGIAVHIGARVMTEAEPGEVLASSTVKDLVVGSGLRFSDRGVHSFKGVPDQWRLYALER